MQTLEAPGKENSVSLWQMQGSIPAAPLSFFYRLGTAAVALTMVLLPLVYIGLIACVGYATYRYAIDGQAMFETRGDEKGKIMLYLAPLVIGGLIVIFMVKPLFARRPKRVEPKEIHRADAPELFSFIDQICDLVRAPRPTRVAIDMQVNASASFRRGFLSLFGNDLTLTIGLPLVAGLTVRQFGGVLAHEFGHFAQGAGMRLTYVIRSVNAWFARLVYERDAWDENLRAAANKIDFRIGIVLQLARLMIWLTRKLLWVFMVAGHGISCFMLRQMEFDADYYETHVAGSDGFTQTSGRLPLLGAAWQRVIGQQQESFENKRLVDDLPNLIAFETQRIPAEVSEAIAKATAAGKTGWFDTHPCDADRVRAAQRIRANGLLTGDEAAGTLFGHFEQLTRAVTEAYYREECEISLQGVQMLPFSEVAADADKQRAEEECMEEIYGDLLNIQTLVFPSHVNATVTQCDVELLRQTIERQRNLKESAKAAEKAMLEADRRIVLAEQARAFLNAGYSIKKADFLLSSANGEGVRRSIELAKQEMATQRELLAEPLEVISRRVQLAVTALGGEDDHPEEFNEARRLLAVLGRFSESTKAIVALRNDVTGLEMLLQNAENASDGTKWMNTARSLAASVEFSVADILKPTEGVSYPFEHADGEIPLKTYLETCGSHDQEVVQSFLRGQAILTHFFRLYFRIMARLAALAKKGEGSLLGTNEVEEVAA
ncbi:M48 family metalloprotease [Verrucomicrobiota bacterium sgz303538]